MIKFRLAFLLLFTFSFAQAQFNSKELTDFKKSMLTAIESSKITDSLLLKLESIPSKSALLLGYQGTLQALKAKHAWNPYNKVKYVSKSLKTMQQAINQDEENMEIRFMRFSIEYYTPSFLGFSKNLDKDQKEIVKHYQNNNFGQTDAALIKNIAKFMIDTKRCTPEEIKILQKKI
jgi:hypothetical protein